MAKKKASATVKVLRGLAEWAKPVPMNGRVTRAKTSTRLGGSIGAHAGNPGERKRCAYCPHSTANTRLNGKGKRIYVCARCTKAYDL